MADIVYAVVGTTMIAISVAIHSSGGWSYLKARNYFWGVAAGLWLAVILDRI